jgi:putative ABC transport system substrate-binding protein
MVAMIHPKLLVARALGFCVVLVVLLTAAHPAAAMPRIGLLSPFAPADTTAWHQAFRQGLKDLGWVEGRNIAIEYRYAHGKRDQLPGLAAELVDLKVDVMVVSVTTDAVVMRDATRTIPIVMVSPGDPVGTGLVASLARPGGNITGLSQVAPDLAGKRLELLKELVPRLSVLAVIWDRKSRVSVLSWKEMSAPARALGIELHSLEVQSPSEFDKAFAGATRARAGAVVIMPGPMFVTNQKRLADLAAKHRLPSIFHLTEFVDAGGLVAYGPDRSDLFRRAAAYVDKILKGAKPGDLPIEQPNKFELAINLKTARALGLTVPGSLLLRVNRVVE